MTFLLSLMALPVGFYLVSFCSTQFYPSIRPFRYNSSSDVRLPEARKTSLHATLENLHHLERTTEGCITDSERIQKLTDWVHQLWLPQPGKFSKSSNPLSIIGRAQKGERFGWTDYNLVLAHALTAIGIPTRLITLRTRDCNYRPIGSHCHGLEYFDRDHLKWVWFDANPGIQIRQGFLPLNIFEIKEAILNQYLLTTDPDISDLSIEQYIAQISPFLDIFVYQPIGQNRLFALVPPQLSIWKNKWGIGPKVYDVRCHCMANFYVSPSIKPKSSVRTITAVETVSQIATEADH